MDIMKLISNHKSRILFINRIRILSRNGEENEKWNESLLRNNGQKFVVGLVSKNGDILCIDIFNTDKEDNFDTYWVDKRNLQIGWKQ